MNNVMVYDTETNGKAKNFKAPMTDLKNWPRITQIAYQVYSREGVLIKEFQSLIKPDGWVIPTPEELRAAGASDEDSMFFVNNNMSTERCEAEGRPMVEVLAQFVEDFDTCNIIVCHNIAFDKPVLGAEMIRYRKGNNNINRTWMCTMLLSMYFCNIPGRYGNPKWPSLTELHIILFGEAFESAHDAMGDVIACARSFFKLVELGVIKLPQII